VCFVPVEMAEMAATECRVASVAARRVEKGTARQRWENPRAYLFFGNLRSRLELASFPVQRGRENEFHV
jgi:hypothetical protein